MYDPGQNCLYCGQLISSNFIERHQATCAFKPDNLKQLTIYISRECIRLSRYHGSFTLPSVEEFNRFCSDNEILGYLSIRKCFRQSVDWHTLITSIMKKAVEKKVVSNDEFPPFLRRYFDPYMFLSSACYNERVEQVEAEEDRHLGYSW